MFCSDRRRVGYTSCMHTLFAIFASITAFFSGLFFPSHAVTSIATSTDQQTLQNSSTTSQTNELRNVGGVPLPNGADSLSFHVTKDGIALDSTHVYTWHTDHFDVLAGADPKTITTVGQCLRVWGEKDGADTPYGKMKDLEYVRDKQHIFPDLEPSTLDANTFVYLGSYQSGPGTLQGRTVDIVGYAKDKNGVYVGCGTKIEGVDMSTFSILDYGYSKDSQHVYFLDKIKAGADPKTFKPTEPDPY